MLRTGGIVLFVTLMVFILYLWVVYFYSRPTFDAIQDYIKGIKKQFSKRKKKDKQQEEEDFK